MENAKSKNVHIATTEEVIGNQVKELIHFSMDAGKTSKKEAWSMAEILDQVSMKFGKEVTPYARKYILQLCTR